MIRKLKSKLIQDKHFSELFKGSSIAFIFKIIGISLGYIFTLLIAKWYGANTMGLYALTLTLLNIFTIISLFGFDNALVKFVADYNSNNKDYLLKEVYNKALTISIPLGILLSLVLFFNADFFARAIFKNKELTIFFQIVSFAIVPLIVLKINGAMFRGLKKIKEFSLFDTVLIFLFGSVILSVFYFFNFTHTIVIVSQVIAILLTMMISLILILKKIPKNNMIKELKYKDILRTSFPILFASSLLLIMSWTDIIMLGILKSETEVGIYSVLIKLAMVTSITLVAINTIAAPKFSELYSKNDIEGLKSIAQNSTKMIFYTTLPIILILSIYPNFILGLFGTEFLSGVSALWILMIGQFINAISGSVGYILNMTGKEKVFQYIILSAASLNIVLNFFLIKKFGINGAAIATSISVSFLYIISMLYVKKYFGFYTFNLFKGKVCQ